MSRLGWIIPIVFIILAYHRASLIIWTASIALLFVFSAKFIGLTPVFFVTLTL